MPARQSLRVLISTSPSDLSSQEELEKHLKTLNRNNCPSVEILSSELIDAGSSIPEAQVEFRNKADLFIFLVSVDFQNNEVCQSDIAAAIERNCQGMVPAIIIVVRKVAFLDPSLANFVIFPKDGKALKMRSIAARDKVWSQVIQEIKLIIDQRLTAENASDVLVNHAANRAAALNQHQIAYIIDRAATHFSQKKHIQSIGNKLAINIELNDNAPSVLWHEFMRLAITKNSDITILINFLKIKEPTFRLPD